MVLFLDLFRKYGVPLSNQIRPNSILIAIRLEDLRAKTKSQVSWEEKQLSWKSTHLLRLKEEGHCLLLPDIQQPTYGKY
jgi:hypothetical protein